MFYSKYKGFDYLYHAVCAHLKVFYIAISRERKERCLATTSVENGAINMPARKIVNLDPLVHAKTTMKMPPDPLLLDKIKNRILDKLRWSTIG